MSPQRVLGVTGWKNSGKTTLVERLVRELTSRGWTVSTVKHAHHDFDIDKPGADSHRHRTAGAHEVAVVSGTRWALMHELRNESEPGLADILSRFEPCDLILVEGYKRELHKKIEVRRAEAKNTTPLSPDDENIIAIASDVDVTEYAIPIFNINAINEIADFCEEATGLK